MTVTIDGATGVSAVQAGAIDATDLPTGSVLQVVQTDLSGVGNGISTTSQKVYVPTGHTAVITTLAPNSKIYVQVNANCYQVTGSGTNIGLQRKIGSGSNTRLLGIDGTTGDTWMGFGNGEGTASGSITRSILDEPNQDAGTVLTYEALLGLWDSGTAYYGYTVTYDFKNTITVMEIAG